MEQSIGLERRISQIEQSITQLGEGTITRAIEVSGLVGNPEGTCAEPTLTLDEAYAIAQSKGYPSSRMSFKDWSLRKPEDCRSAYGLVRLPGNKGGRGQKVFAVVADS